MVLSKSIRSAPETFLPARYALTAVYILISLIAVYALVTLIAFRIHLHRYPTHGKLRFTIPGIPDMGPYQTLYEQEKQRWDKAEKEPVEITSYDGLRLRGLFFPCANARGAVVLSHGYHCSGRHDYWDLLGPYLDRGFSVLVFDQRACGKSEGSYITMGVKESRDVADWCALAKKKAPGLPLLVHGMSMGGATVLMALDRLQDQARALVIDCAYCTPYETVEYVYSRYNKALVRLLLPGAELWARALAGFSLHAKDTTECLKTNRLPVFFLHGEPDGLVPTECTRRNVKACTAPHEVLYIPGAGHTECFLKGREEALRALDTFLDTYFFAADA